MGGFGSGRTGSRKPVVERLKRIELKKLHRDGALSRGAVSVLTWTSNGEVIGNIGIVNDGDGLRFMYQCHNRIGSSQDVDEKVRFNWSKMRFGGQRPWFLCPGCSRRCLILYVRTCLRCGNCQCVRYASQSESKADRANRAMFKIVERLDPTAEMNFLPLKPKGMHWRTYDRWVDRYAFQDERWSEEMIRRFGISS